MAISSSENISIFSQKDLDVLFKEFESDQIHFAVLFGSFATDSNHEGSDVDIAIFAGKNKHECFKLQLKYASKVEKLSDKKMDIVILDYSSLILAHKVIKVGKLLFENKLFSGSYNKYKEFVISRYPDLNGIILN